MKITKFKTLPFSLLIFAVFAQACNSNQKKDSADSTATIHTMADDSTAGSTSAAGDTSTNMKDGSPVNKFLEQAAIGGMVEVQMGKIGQQKASLKSIKEFAAMIEKDHTEANAQLSALASAKGFTLPAELTAEKKEHLTHLNNNSGKNFDSYYINMMVEDHINDISLFEGATKSPDTAISSFAKKVLPVLQKHYKQAREISMQFDQNKKLAN